MTRSDQTSPKFNRRGRVAEQAYEFIKGQIVSLELEPGEALSEKQIADRIGVSRTPVREAFIKLSEEELVDIYPQYGTFVAPIRAPAVRDAEFVRRSLECSVVREAAMASTDVDAARLEAILGRQAEALDSEDIEAFFVEDETLHAAIFGLAGRHRVWQFVQLAKVHMDRVRKLTLPLPQRVEEILQQHREIVMHITSGHPDGAELAMSDHLGFVVVALDSIAERHPEYFERESNVEDATGPVGRVKSS